MLSTQKEIPTPIDILSWDYYQYVKKNPIIEWTKLTYILYGGKDNLQSLPVIKQFAESTNSILTISNHSEHSFICNGDNEIVKKWMSKNL